MKKRFNIGIVVANLIDSFSNRVTKGAIAAAEELDANLFIFPMKYLEIQYAVRFSDMKYEYQHNILMQYAAESKLDYLIVCIGTVAYLSSDERKKEMLKIFDGTPILSVPSKLEGYDYLVYDNVSGITDAVDYLAQTQHRKHICMMIGDMNNQECVLRYNAYRSALEKNGLPFEERMVMESDVSPYCEEEGNALLDANPECDALLCINDDMAAVFYDILRQRGKIVGQDILLAGFDDLPFAVKLDPPLASVKADAYELGAHAVRKALNFLNGVPDTDHYHSTEFIVRGSCCPDYINLNKVENLFTGTPGEIADKMLGYIFRGSVLSEESGSMIAYMSGLVSALYERIVLKIAEEEDYSYIHTMTENYFSCNRYDTEVTPRVINIIDGASIWLEKNAPPENLPVIRKLFKYFFFKINSLVIGQLKTIEDDHTSHLRDSNLFIRDTLMLGENVEQSYAKIMCKFYCIGLRSSFLFLLDKPTAYYEGEPFGKTSRWRFMSYQQGKNFYMIPEQERYMTPPRVYSNPYVTDDKRHTYIVADLYSLEYQYGILLCEPEDNSFFNDLELVIYQVSGAVRLIHMIHEQEKMVDQLHIKNLALENMSGIDELTGIYNRRGFYNAVESFIEINKGRQFIVCYADMDNLKMVNDGYGHSEGDFCIKQLAAIMSEIFGKTGIVGRMGGDEYAACILKDEDISFEMLIRKKSELIERLNHTAQKPYRIGMSMGLFEGLCENSFDFKTALDKADGVLYGEKAKRKKEI